MNFGDYRYYDIDSVLRKYGAPATNWTPRLKLKERGGKWHDQKGPNPLTRLGLEQS